MPYKDLETRRIKARGYSRRYREKHDRDRRSDPSYGRSYGIVPNEVSAAQRRVYVAIKKGFLVRPEQCEECGRYARIEAAHHDYSQPLSVRWLCRPCHRNWDWLVPKGGRALEWAAADKPFPCSCGRGFLTDLGRSIHMAKAPIHMRSAEQGAERAHLIRERYAEGGISGGRLAAQFGVSPMLVSLIVRGRVWATRRAREMRLRPC